jgi:short-subunit dehydrogenase
MEEIKDLPREIFINNAGFGDCGSFINGSLSKEQDMIDVNIKALHTLMKLALQKMERDTLDVPASQKKPAYLLNVASSAGLLPAGPYMATYYATKAYVTSLTQGVAAELKEARSNIYVGCLCPGPVDTEFNSVANVEFALKGISAEYCANYGINQMFRKKTVIIPTWFLKVALTFGRMIPRKLCVSIAARQQKKKLHGANS